MHLSAAMAPHCLAGRPGTSASSLSSERKHWESNPTVHHGPSVFGTDRGPFRRMLPCRPTGRSRTSAACLSDTPVDTATTAGWSEVRGSNSPPSLCESAVVTRRHTSEVASPPRIERGATTFGGSRRVPPERREWRARGESHASRAGLQSAPTLGHGLTLHFVDPAGVAPARAVCGTARRTSRTSPDGRAGKESNPAPEAWRLRCALRSDPRRLVGESNPLSPGRQPGCDASRITRQRVSPLGVEPRACALGPRRRHPAGRGDGVTHG